MSKYRHIGRQEQKELLDSIGETGNRLVIGMDFNEEKVYYACTVRKMYTICRLYLLSMGKNEFIDFMHFCYPDIYFDESVPASINTLNRNFPDLQSEIVNHLNALNDYKGVFLQLTGENKGYRYIAEKFQRDTGIECSPQAGRDKVSALKRTFINELNDVPMTVTCELHTKFKRFNTDRTKQDRIYFAPAKKEIKKGKVIVVHIGKHL